MGDALAIGSLFVAFTLAAVTPSAPTSMPSSSPAPLKEIGHVRATTPFCQGLLPDAVDAVEIETANDEKLDAVYGAMRTADFDSSRLAKFKSTHAMTERYVALRAAAIAGIDEVKRLRANAQAATGDDQRKALTDFADALGGALNRQKVLADDLGRFIAYLDSHESLSKEDRDALVFQAMIDQSNSLNYQTRQVSMQNYAMSPLDKVPPLLSTVAKDGADDLQQRARPIAMDEKKASDLIDPAFAGC
jgi:hypothetical protein